MVLFSSCAPTSGPVPLGTDTYFYGNMDRGQKFGVRVGDTLSKAKSSLVEAGFAYYSDGKCGYAVEQVMGCRGGDTYSAFGLDSWYKHGEVFLATRNGQVLAIGWKLYFLPRVDL